jgi:hypothetical protein
MRTIRTSSQRRAFTAMELMLGMLVTSLIMTAIAGLMTAVGHGWKQTTSTEASSNVITQSHTRMQKMLRASRQIGRTREGSLDGSSAYGAAVMLWAGDTNQDSLIQVSEVALIQHDTDAESIKLYAIEWPSAWTTAQKEAADTTLDDDDIYGATAPELFKVINHVEGSDLVKDVVGAVFIRRDSASTVRPGFEYVLKIERDEQTETEYGSATLRVPATMPISQR